MGTKPIKVPEKAYQAAKQEAEERDIPMGSVIEMWREDARGGCDE